MTFRCGELGCFFPTSGNFRGENEYEAVNLVVPSFQTNLENWNEQWWKVELLIIAGGNSQKKWWVQPAKSSKSGFCQVFFGALTMQENCRCHWIMGKCEFQALVSEWSSNFSGKMSSLFPDLDFQPPKNKHCGWLRNPASTGGGLRRYSTAKPKWPDHWSYAIFLFLEGLWMEIGYPSPPKKVCWVDRKTNTFN